MRALGCWLLQRRPSLPPVSARPPLTPFAPPTQELYYRDGDFRGAKALIAAAFAGVAVKAVKVDGSSAAPAGHGGGKLPVLVTPEGVLSQSNAILRYLGNVREDATLHLAGRSAVEAAQVDQWLDFSSEELEPIAHVLLLASTAAEPVLGVSEAAVAKSAPAARARLGDVLGVLEAHLTAHTFLVGERVSLADVALSCALLGVFSSVLTSAEREGQFPALTRWFMTCMNQPEFVGVVGSVQLSSGGGGGGAAAPTTAGTPAAAAGGAGGAGGAGASGTPGTSGGFGFTADGVMRVPQIPALFNRGRVRLADILDTRECCCRASRCRCVTPPGGTHAPQPAPLDDEIKSYPMGLISRGRCVFTPLLENNFLS